MSRRIKMILTISNAEKVMDDFHIPTIIDWESEQYSDYERISHTLVKVSGVDFNWGGGQTPGSYLHCHSAGTTDYTNTLLHANSSESGSSVVKSRVEAFLTSEVTTFMSEYSAWSDDQDDHYSTLTGTDEEKDVLLETWITSNPEPAVPSPTVIDSNEITITWN